MHVSAPKSRIKDFDEQAIAKTKLALRQNTKTKTSNRLIAVASVVMDKLKQYKEKQLLARKKYKKKYNNLNMVFCREDGNYVDPSTFRDFYLKVLEDAGIEEAPAPQEDYRLFK